MHQRNTRGRFGGLTTKLRTFCDARRHRRIEKVRSRISRKLELDALQEMELEILLQSVSEITSGSRQKKQEVMSKMADLIVDPQFDRDTARAVVADVTATYETRVSDAIAHFGNLYDALNETQRIRLRGFAARRRWHAAP